MLTGVFSCSTEVDIYAPEKELYVVYGILNAQSDVQYIKVGRVYQDREDPYGYAQVNDLSARNFVVSVEGGGKVYHADLVDGIQRGAGLFVPEGSAYRFFTSGDSALVEEERYTLRIRKPDDPDFEITAWTDVPSRPEVTSPGRPLRLRNYNYTFPTIDFLEDYHVFFKPGSGRGFEVRLYLQFFDGPVEKEVIWGPTQIFLEPYRCAPASDEFCYQIPKLTVPRNLASQLEQSVQDSLIFVDEPRLAATVSGLSRAVRMEVTAVDSFTTDFLRVNQSFGFGLNLLMDRPEITNVSGGNIGVFGAVNVHHRFFNLGTCTKYLAGLIPVAPSFCD